MRNIISESAIQYQCQTDIIDHTVLPDIVWALGASTQHRPLQQQWVLASDTTHVTTCSQTLDAKTAWKDALMPQISYQCQRRQMEVFCNMTCQSCIKRNATVKPDSPEACPGGSVPSWQDEGQGRGSAIAIWPVSRQGSGPSVDQLLQQKDLTVHQARPVMARRGIE